MNIANMLWTVGAFALLMGYFKALKASVMLEDSVWPHRIAFSISIVCLTIAAGLS